MNRITWVKEAFEERYFIFVNHIFPIVEDYDIAKDCVSEALTKCLELDFEIRNTGHAASIIVQISKRLAFKANRRLKVSGKYQDYIISNNEINQTDFSWDYYPANKIAFECLNNLPPLTKQVILSWAHGLDAGTIGFMFNLSSSAVRLRVSQNIKAIRVKMLGETYKPPKRKTISDRVFAMLEIGMTRPEISKALCIPIGRIHGLIKAPMYRARARNN